MSRIGREEGEGSEAVVQERIRQAEEDLQYIEQGDYMLPASRDAQGSKTYWLTLKQGLERSPQFGPEHIVTKEAARIFDVLDNGGQIREQSLVAFKDLVNRLALQQA